MEFIGRFLHKPKESFFLFGPRGTGKSLWTKHYLKDEIRLDFLQPNTLREYSSYPERLYDLVKANPDKKIFVLDEVQKIPAILNVVHSLIEEQKGIQFVLTGSSARKIKRSGVDLLAGRAVMRHLCPFMAAELGNLFSLEKVLKYGLLPLIWSANDPQDALNAYHGLYLREEVQMEAMVRDIGNFSRFLEIISFSHASILSISNISRDCEVGRKAIEGYINVLEDLLLSFKINVFTKRAKRELAEHPKFYFFDAGVFRSIRPKGPLDNTPEMDGMALEGLVAQHLQAWISYRGKDNALYFWRTRGGSEVDFIVYGEDGIWAIEVKNSSKIHPQDLRSLKSFRKDYPESKAIFLYRGTDRLLKDNILCIPCEEFLKNLHPEKPILP